MFNLPVLPDMRCDRGCGECCGIVPASREEFERVKRFAKRRGIKPIEQGITCPWYQDGQCAVYDARPLICRMYGHIDNPRLTCPRGYNVNVSRDDRDRLEEAVERRDVRLLHEILPGWEATIKAALE